MIALSWTLSIATVWICCISAYKIRHKGRRFKWKKFIRCYHIYLVTALVPVLNIISACEALLDLMVCIQNTKDNDKRV